MDARKTSHPVILSVYPIAEHHVDTLAESGATVVVAPSDDEDTLIAAAADASAIITRGPARITSAVLDSATLLKVVSGIGSGTDSIDVAHATERGVVVTSGVGLGKFAVAEWVIGAMLMAHRRMPSAHEELAGGGLDWSSRFVRFRTRQVTGSSIGIIGMGEIGREIARLAHAFNMNVRAYDPFMKDAPPDYVEFCSDLDEMLAVSATVSVNVPLTPQTRDLIGAAQLACMSAGSVVVNASRGGVVNEAALADALVRGHLAAAVLDVFDPEPPSPEQIRRLAAVPNLMLSPHVAGVTDAAFERLVENAVDCVIDVLAGQRPQNVVNAPAAERQELRSR